jgi:nitroimidazol reductase NimA-like FMN-containing flavoprotein (pyridoxamine 5'-phosphate oxidase superfamily)/ribosomal protein S18 acetylase RimI-like enzyme
MRREIHRSDPARALALLRRAPFVHLATTTPEGTPVLRALDAAVLDDGVYFHGARAGEKAGCLGRPAVVSAEEAVAHVASWMVDPVMACPASTLYRSVQVHGTLREVVDPVDKARALEALMRRWQPEGRYAPIDPADPRYRKELAATLVFSVPLERVDGKEKLLQNRRPAEVVRVLEALWERGAAGDAEAIEAVRGANPAVPDPAFLPAGDGLRWSVALGDDDLAGADALLAGEYWWEGLPRGWIGPAHRAAQAWVGARAADGTLVATARAVSDGKVAWVYDVAVAAGLRGRGIGKRVMALLLDHPAVRRVPYVKLSTRDAQGLYARFGFVDAGDRRRFPTATDMVLVRPGTGAP